MPFSAIERDSTVVASRWAKEGWSFAAGLEPKVGSRRAWIYGAFLYALAHLPTAFALRDANLGPNPVLPLAALACGLVWAFAVRKTGRLVPTILAHALFDWCVIVGYRLAGPSF